MPDEGVPFTAIVTISDPDEEQPVFTDMRQNASGVGHPDRRHPDGRSGYPARLILRQLFHDASSISGGIAFGYT